jgi:hypothetical protein
MLQKELNRMPQSSDPFIVLCPQAECFPQGGGLAPRLHTLESKTIAFLDNNKLQPTNRYFALLGKLLKERQGVKEIIHTQKPFFTRPAREDVLQPIIAQADAVVTGVGE